MMNRKGNSLPGHFLGVSQETYDKALKKIKLGPVSKDGRPTNVYVNTGYSCTLKHRPRAISYGGNYPPVVFSGAQLSHKTGVAPKFVPTVIVDDGVRQVEIQARSAIKKPLHPIPPFRTSKGEIKVPRKIRKSSLDIKSKKQKRPVTPVGASHVFPYYLPYSEELQRTEQNKDLPDNRFMGGRKMKRKKKMKPESERKKSTASTIASQDSEVMDFKDFRNSVGIIEIHEDIRGHSDHDEEFPDWGDNDEETEDWTDRNEEIKELTDLDDEIQDWTEGREEIQSYTEHVEEIPILTDISRNKKAPDIINKKKLSHVTNSSNSGEIRDLTQKVSNSTYDERSDVETIVLGNTTELAETVDPRYTIEQADTKEPTETDPSGSMIESFKKGSTFDTITIGVAPTDEHFYKQAKLTEAVMRMLLDNDRKLRELYELCKSNECPYSRDANCGRVVVQAEGQGITATATREPANKPTKDKSEENQRFFLPSPHGSQPSKDDSDENLREFMRSPYGRAFEMEECDDCRDIDSPEPIRTSFEDGRFDPNNRIQHIHKKQGLSVASQEPPNEENTNNIFYAMRFNKFLEPYLGLNPKFIQPGSDFISFRLKLIKNKVCLEHVVVQEHDVVGYIKVANLAPGKTVFMRVTLDGWTSYRDYPAKYVTSLGQWDTFVFRVDVKEVRPKLDQTYNMIFAICYDCNKGTYWDNNNWKNYSLDIKPLLGFEYEGGDATRKQVRVDSIQKGNDSPEWWKNVQEREERKYLAREATTFRVNLSDSFLKCQNDESLCDDYGAISQFEGDLATEAEFNNSNASNNITGESARKEKQKDFERNLPESNKVSHHEDVQDADCVDVDGGVVDDEEVAVDGEDVDVELFSPILKRRNEVDRTKGKCNGAAGTASRNPQKLKKENRTEEAKELCCSSDSIDTANKPKKQNVVEFAENHPSCSVKTTQVLEQNLIQKNTFFDLNLPNYFEEITQIHKKSEFCYDTNFIGTVPKQDFMCESCLKMFGDAEKCLNQAHDMKDEDECQKAIPNGLLWKKLPKGASCSDSVLREQRLDTGMDKLHERELKSLSEKGIKPCREIVCCNAIKKSDTADSGTEQEGDDEENEDDEEEEDDNEEEEENDSGIGTGEEESEEEDIVDKKSVALIKSQISKAKRISALFDSTTSEDCTSIDALTGECTESDKGNTEGSAQDTASSSIDSDPDIQIAKEILHEQIATIEKAESKLHSLTKHSSAVSKISLRSRKSTLKRKSVMFDLLKSQTRALEACESILHDIREKSKSTEKFLKDHGSRRSSLASRGSISPQQSPERNLLKHQLSAIENCKELLSSITEESHVLKSTTALVKGGKRQSHNWENSISLIEKCRAILHEICEENKSRQKMIESGTAVKGQAHANQITLIQNCEAMLSNMCSENLCHELLKGKPRNEGFPGNSSDSCQVFLLENCMDVLHRISCQSQCVGELLNELMKMPRTGQVLPNQVPGALHHCFSRETPRRSEFDHFQNRQPVSAPSASICEKDWYLANWGLKKPKEAIDLPIEGAYVTGHELDKRKRVDSFPRKSSIPEKELRERFPIDMFKADIPVNKNVSQVNKNWEVEMGFTQYRKQST